MNCFHYWILLPVKMCYYMFEGMNYLIAYILYLLRLPCLYLGWEESQVP